MSLNNPGKDVTDAQPSDSSLHGVDSEPIPSNDSIQPTPDTRLFYPRPVEEATKLTIDRRYIDAEEYIMDHDERGKALIINNVNFCGDLSDRQGSTVDATAMYSRFSDLGFDIEALNDASAADIMEKLKEIADEDHSDADCFVCVILTHGDAEGLHGTTGRLKETDIMDCFNADKCPTLAFKPKIFIFQACRGVDTDRGTKFRVTDGNVLDASGDTEEYDKFITTQLPQLQTIKIPNEMNFLVCYASSYGKLSNRHTEKGSVYIQALSQEMMKMKSNEDFLTVLTRVNNIVAYEFEHQGNDPRHQGMKQMPCFISRLTKTLKFKEK